MNYIMGFLAALSIMGQTVTLDVDFKMIELERPDRPIAGVPVRLVLGQAKNWQSPEAGYRFITGAQGDAKFSAAGIVDRRWTLMPVGFTGVSLPKRADHIAIAVEAEQLVPAGTGEYRHFQWLYKMDIDCYDQSDCATSGISAIYTRDANGWFTREGEYRPLDGLKMPELGGMMLSGPGYKASGLFLHSVDPDRKRWRLQMTLQRKPAPVWR